MAGNYGSGSVTVNLDSTPGGSQAAIHNFLLNGLSAKDIAETMETTGLGDSAREHTPTGMEAHEDIPLEGLWDTTSSTGSHAVLGSVDTDPNGGTRTLTVVMGDSKTWAGECILAEYEVIAEVGSLTKFRAVLRPSGAFTWS